MGECDTSWYEHGHKSLSDLSIRRLVKSIIVPMREICLCPSAQPHPHVKPTSLTFQELLFRLQAFWAERGCVLQQPYDVEVGAGTMAPETFLRVLGPKPYRVGYAQPSRRPADGRYGENPNRLFKHTQFQLILKPPPVNVQELYLESLEAMGIDLKHHDLKFEEDNWEWPAGGAWGVGWQVMLDGLEITQFTYFQQCGGTGSRPHLRRADVWHGAHCGVSAGCGLDLRHRVGARSGDRRGGDLRRRAAGRGAAVLGVQLRDGRRGAGCGSTSISYEAEAQALLEQANALLADEKASAAEKRRFPLLPTYELALKCSNLFNLLDARGAISVTERVGVIGRIRDSGGGRGKGVCAQQAGQLSSAQRSLAELQRARAQI